MNMQVAEPTLLNHIVDYWNDRAASYSHENRLELDSEQRTIWTEVLLKNAPEKPCLNVLDVGTGPGFFAIILALAGHKVTSVDVCGEMIGRARQNAQAYGVEIDFLQSDVHQLALAENSFDLIVCRNVTWTLENPEEAYAHWYELLNPEGRLLVFDANWYMHLFDAQFAQGFKEDRANTVTFGVADHYEGTDTVAMEAIARRLPLSSILRPQWDLQTLSAIGFRKCVADTEIWKQVWNQEEKINGASTPMFMIVAQK